MRIVTAREQVEMLLPWRTSMAWYHGSPHDLPDGTQLTPGGGKTAWDEFYDNEDDRRNHVWLSDTPEAANRWGNAASMDGTPSHVYEVEPLEEPRLYKDDSPWDGHVVPSATIKRRL